EVIGGEADVGEQIHPALRVDVEKSDQELFEGREIAAPYRLEGFAKQLSDVQGGSDPQGMDFLVIAVQVASMVPSAQFLVLICKKGFSEGFLSAIDDGVDAGQLLEIVLDLVEKYRVHDAAQDQAQRGVFSALPVKGDFLAALGPVIETDNQYLLGPQLNRGG